METGIYIWARGTNVMTVKYYFQRLGSGAPYCFTEFLQMYLYSILYSCCVFRRLFFRVCFKHAYNFAYVHTDF